MILNKVYEEFVETTGLTDSMYKTVFVQIGDVLSLINNVTWMSLVYSIGDSSYPTDFMGKAPTPLYVVEIAQNLFEKSYTFPESSKVELDVRFKGKFLKVTCEGDKVNIPQELGYVKHYSLFPFFLITKKVYDIFEEFDSLFSFVNRFKTKVKSIYAPLEQNFEKTIVKKSIDSGNVTNSGVASRLGLVENMKKNRDDLLKRTEKLRNDREKLVQDKNNISQILKKKEGLFFEKSNLDKEYELLQESYDKDKKKFDKVVDILATIDSELLSQNNSETPNNTEIIYLKEKKDAFTGEKIALENSLNDTHSLKESLLVRINSLKNDITNGGDYNATDVGVMESKIAAVDKERDEIYGALVTLENEIKQQSASASNESKQIEMSKETPMPSGIDSISRKNIVEHLSSPLQPTSVTTVMNYLRYYFAYHTTKIATQLSTVHSNVDQIALQSLACKLTLVRHFGVYYNNVFSAVNFVDDRVGHVTLVDVKA